MSQTIVL